MDTPLILMVGSSPLARGLRTGGAVSGRGTRIIPARAGFTCPPRRSLLGRRDHPRSRGVYGRLPYQVVAGFGSSPLARGLRIQMRLELRHVGIIPARAGFTRSSPPGSSPVTDHPRSRGVYAPAGLVRVDVGGSSPLARGLLRVPASRGGYQRIIPARAGFTRTPDRVRLPAPDHPRSRGVYSPPSLVCACAQGSSPLARGLPHGLRTNSPEPRIIPARAGFTFGWRRRVSLPADHPRSRGVYHGLVQRVEEVLRIIPARAGFTP